MQSEVYRAPSTGLIQAKQGGFGFALFPAVPPGADSLGAQRPGTFPVHVRLSGNRTFTIANSTPILLGTPFSLLEVLDAGAGDAWQVMTFDGDERIAIAGSKTRASRFAVSGTLEQATTQAAVAALAVGPLANGQVKLDANAGGLSLYLAGLSAGSVYLWTRPTPAGAWYLYERLELDGVDATAVLARSFPAGEVYVTGSWAGGARPMFELFALFEVG
jgi:hypothetical protein